MIIRDHTILVNDTPKDIYNNPKEKYIAALFDDVSEITINNKKQLVYPHQIKIIEKSELKATVLQSYYKGFYWLIAADFNGQKVFINHTCDVEKNAKVNLEFLLN